MTSSSLSPDESRQQCDDYEQLPLWDDESVPDGQYDGGIVHSDVEDFNGLVSQPRQVVPSFSANYLYMGLEL